MLLGLINYCSVALKVNATTAVAMNAEGANRPGCQSSYLNIGSWQVHEHKPVGTNTRIHTSVRLAGMCARHSKNVKQPPTKENSR